MSAKIHSKCALLPKIAKNSLKTHIFGVQGRSGSSMLVHPESSLAAACYDTQQVCVYLQPFSC